MSEGVDAVAYHERTKHSPRSVRESGHRLDFENRPRPYKAYEGLPEVPLPEPGDLPDVPALRAITGDWGERGDWGEGHKGSTGGEADRAPAEITRETVAALCHYATGNTKVLRRGDREIPFRAAACTGALYHVDLYVVCGDLADLDAGVYHFDPRDRSLDVLREGDFRDALAAATGGEDAVRAAPLSFVATSTWWRNAWKYRERTYRHAFWDSGTVLANLASVAAVLGLPTEVVLGFVDGDVADLLGVDPVREAPLEVVPVGAGSGAPASPPVEPLDPETRPLSEREREFELIREAYRASALPDASAVREWRGTGAPADPPWLAAAGDGPRIDLDPVGDDRASKVPLDVAIERRGSCREYARETLNRRKVATVLDRALNRSPAPLDVADPDGPPLQFADCYLVVHGVSGVPSGAYHYHPTEGALELLREGNFRWEAGHLALDQRLAADAGLVAFFATDVAAVRDRFGDRGYRVAQLEAALAAGRLYLGAYAHRDLGATGLTFYDDAVTDFLSPRAADQTPLFCWTLGRPA
ncbi:SagB/ThcOx family dehydrogenase [Halegenticoccus soli]|uniref:SagB/ThcOx family dehydrogenase n=1 Tax=Halegenticoccus soli TaxID=1985678 RepID=UPI000C6E498F|nr:SagB/ThcOx family dehydrogenase [Halegenticoccus soli]